MNARSFFIAIGVVAGAGIGCESILGLEDRKLFTETDAGGDVSVDATEEDAVEEEAAVVLPPGCELPATGDAKARVGNFVTSALHYDFCVAPTGGDWTTIKPLFGSYADCPKGLGFRDVSFFFSEPSGTYDVKMIALGGACADEAIAAAQAVSFDTNKVTAIYAFGDGVQTPVLKKFQESTPGAATSWYMRFIHAANGVGPLDFGVTDQPALPANIVGPMFDNIVFGTTSSGGTSIDANGYRDNQTGGGALSFGVAPTGTTQASIAGLYDFSSNRAYTVFGTGSQNKPGFPTGLWVCDEKNPMGNATPAEKVLAKCGNGTPRNVAVDVYNTQLNGAFSGYEPQRRPKVFEEVAALDSDVVCVTEIWSDADKDALIAAAAGTFPHSYYAKHDLTTPVDDAVDQNGQTPAAPSLAPCANSMTKMNALFDCIKAHCVDKLNDETGVPLNGIGACLQKPGNCIAQVLALATNKPDAGDPASDLSCWSCAFTQMASYASVETMRTQCGTKPEARYAFSGADGVVLLSKHPIDKPNTKAWVLGATEWRVSVYKAPITFDNGASADAYCTVLTTPASDCMTRGYTGNYGGTGKDCKEQWTNELVLQSKKLTDFVQKESLDLKHQALIPGDFYAGIAYDNPDPVTLDLAERYPEAYGNLTAKLAVAVPADFIPLCTYCGDNPIVTPPGTPVNAASTWTSIVFMGGIPISEVVSASTILKDPSVPVTFDDGGVLNIPASQYYGFRSVVRLRP
jgi:hypothetical protein